jgi:ABC-2 type transport system permease protein
LLTQVKFLLGISAFWIAEPGGFLEIWNILTGVFGGRLLPLNLLPAWLLTVGHVLPFASMYAFPMQLLLGEPTTQEMWSGFAIQTAWLLALSALVRWSWKRGLIAYEAYGG